ncbi:MAG TPA: ATP-binding protein [Thermodesulfobacteriota bacterium]|nr:ATP-binding protein [Thermodesulfobacteriota bacterium]
MRTRWTVSIGGASREGRGTPTGAEKVDALLEAKESGRPALSHPVVLQDGQEGVFACLPIYSKGSLEGYLVAMFKSREMFDDVFLAMRHLEINHYTFEILDGKKALYSRHPEALGSAEFTEEIALPLYGATWRVRMGLDPAYLSVVRSSLPGVALSLGFVWTIVLTSAVHFAQTARLKGKELEAANVNLKHEVRERREAEEKVVRFNRLYSVLSKVDEAIVRIREPQALFREACRICVEDGDFVMTWVGMTDPETLRVRPVAYWGVEEGYLENVLVSASADMPEGRGPTGSAVREGRYSVCGDIAHDPKTAPWRATALSRGYRSSASFPLLLGGRTVGALSLYASEPEFFDGPLVGLLNSLSADLSFAMDSAEAEKKRRLAEGELREYKAHLEDLVEVRTAELMAVNRELEAFTYSASHDLQEPLRIVAGYTQLLARRYKGKLDSDADEFINYAVDAATRMQRLISDLLAYSRLGRKLDFRTIDTEEAVLSATKNLKTAIEESGAEITYGKLPKIEANAQLSNVFMNLIGNAIKYRGAKPPRIHIDAARVANSWQFSVSDNGIGIEPRHNDRIFEIFQRLHGKADYPGTGIGLSICKKIIENHGGRIWVESRPGEGSTFYFNIPDRKEVKYVKN